MKLETPNNSRKVLLHSCCAPCSGAIIECMDQNGIKPLVFFSNSNIDTREEYDKRLSELRRYCALFGLELFSDEYDHRAWLDYIKGDEDAPERGPRCLKCFQFRLERAAAYARAHGYEVVTTSLASSRWKSLEQVNRAGEIACGEDLCWWNQNWRKGGLQPRRSEIVKQQGFYNQTWCGCEFSKPKI